MSVEFGAAPHTCGQYPTVRTCLVLVDGNKVFRCKQTPGVKQSQVIGSRVSLDWSNGCASSDFYWNTSRSGYGFIRRST